MAYKDLGAWWEEGGKCKKEGSFPSSTSRWAKDLVFFLAFFAMNFKIGLKD